MRNGWMSLGLHDVFFWDKLLAFLAILLIQRQNLKCETATKQLGTYAVYGKFYCAVLFFIV